MTTQAKTFLPLITVMLFTLASCDNSNGEEKTNEKHIVKKPKRQDVYDAHGCFTSGGYLWSDAKDTCILLWESATELQATNGTELVWYALTSEDKMEAEIFIPEDTSFLLKGKGNDVYTNDSLSLTVTGKDLVLKKNGKTIYHTAPPEPEEAPKPRRRKR